MRPGPVTPRERFRDEVVVEYFIENAVGGKAPLLICSGAASRRGLPMGVQLGFMEVQLGGKVIWAGLLGRGCGCGDW